MESLKLNETHESLVKKLNSNFTESKTNIDTLSSNISNASKLTTGTISTSVLPEDVVLKNESGKVNISDIDTTNLVKNNESNILSGAQTINGNLTINGDIIQNGESYITRTEEIVTENDYIILRDGAEGSLGDGYAGFQVKRYDGITDGRLVIDANGVARVGDVGDEQPLATREEFPLSNGFARWNELTGRFETTTAVVTDADLVEVTARLDDTYTKAQVASMLSDKVSKDDLPEKLSDFSQDEYHRTVTDEEKETWNNKSDFSGNYVDLENRPTIPEKVSQLENDSNFATKDYVDQAAGTSLDYVSNILINGETVEKDDDKNVDLKLSNVALTGDYKDLTNKPTVPTLVSELTNDADYVTKATKDLENYYSKVDTYSKEEITNVLNTLRHVSIQKVDTLPAINIMENVIYLVPVVEGGDQDYFDEYIYLNGSWEKIGSTKTTVADVYTKSEVNSLLSEKASLEDIPTTLAELSGDTSNRTVTDNQIENWNNKSDFSGSYNDLEDKPTLPTKTSQLENDSGFVGKSYVDTLPYVSYNLQTLTEEQKAQVRDNIGVTGGGSSEGGTSNYLDLTNKPTLNTQSDVALSPTNETISGSVMLHKISKTGSFNDLLDKPTVDEELSESSTNTVQNKTVAVALSLKADRTELPKVDATLSSTSNNAIRNSAVAEALATKVSSSDLAKVATTGSYNDLADQPAIITEDQVKDASNLTSGTLSDDRLSNNVVRVNKANNFEVGQTINGDLTVNGNIIQNGESYITSAEVIKTSNDYIVMRDEAPSGLTAGEYSGLEFFRYDGVNSGRLAIDSEGVVRVGDIGSEQPLATREETPINGGFAKWDESSNKFITSDDVVTTDVLNGYATTSALETVEAKIPTIVYSETEPENPVEGMIWLKLI